MSAVYARSILTIARIELAIKKMKGRFRGGHAVDFQVCVPSLMGSQIITY